jgi:hypothetical protein
MCSILKKRLNIGGTDYLSTNSYSPEVTLCTTQDSINKLSISPYRTDIFSMILNIISYNFKKYIVNQLLFEMKFMYNVVNGISGL